MNSREEFDQLVANQHQVMELVQSATGWIKFAIVLLCIAILMITAIFIWKIIVYPSLLALTRSNEELLAVLREVMYSFRRKQDVTIEKQNVTIEKVEEVDRKVTPVAEVVTQPWIPGVSADRRQVDISGTIRHVYKKGDQPNAES